MQAARFQALLATAVWQRLRAVAAGRPAVDGGQHLYADTQNSKVTAATGIITTIAGNGSSDPAVTTAWRRRMMATPIAVAVDLAATFAESLPAKVTAATGIITTIAGNGFSGFTGDNGPSTSAQLSFPQGVGVDAAGNVYIADTTNQRIRKISAATGVITTVAGGAGGASFAGENLAATAAELQPDRRGADAAGNIYR